MAGISFTVDGVVQRIELTEPEVTLGRGVESKVRFKKDSECSRKHCKIVKTAQGFKVVDLGGRNGTYINGTKLPEHDLKHGDVIKIGQTAVTFETQGAPAAAPAPPKARTSETAARPAPTSASPVPAKSPGTSVLPAPPAPKADAPPLIELPDPPTIGPGDRPPAPAAPPPPPPAPPAAPAAPPVAPAGAVTESQRLRPGPRPTHLASASHAVPRSASKGPMIGVAIAGGLLVLAGVLWFLSSRSQASHAKAAEVRGQLRREIEGIQKLPKNDTIARDERVEKLLADPIYAQHAPELFAQLKADHEKLHAQAEKDKVALPTVKPWLEKYAQAKSDPLRYQAEAEKLFEESKPLLERWGDTSFAADLLEARSDLKDLLERRMRPK